MDRMDIIHKFFHVARELDRNAVAGLHQRPLPRGARVLDLGCGTGIWSIDMAEYAVSDGALPPPLTTHLAVYIAMLM